jgi:hypothetical protein
MRPADTYREPSGGVMRLDEVNFLFQVPVLMVICQILFVVLVWGMLAIARLLGYPVWTRRERPRKLLSLLVVMVIPFVPIVGVLVICGIGLVVLVLVLFYALTAVTPWGWPRLVEPRIRLRLRNLKEAGWTMAPLAKRPYWFPNWSKELAKLGFVPVFTGELAEGISRATFVKPGEGVIADLLDQPLRLDRIPVPIVNLISVMPDRRGALSTLVGADLSRSPGLIAQSPGVSLPATILARHQEARALLWDHGIDFVQIEASDVTEILAWFSGEMVDGLLAPGPLRMRLRDTFGKRLMATMLTDPEALGRIRALAASFAEGRAPADELTEPVRDARGSVPAGP